MQVDGCQDRQGNGTSARLRQSGRCGVASDDGFVMGCVLCVHFLLVDDLRAPLPERFWNEAIAGSLLVWLILFVARIFLFMSDFATAERWRRIQQGELAEAMSAGRRFQQVVAVSLHTALREVDEESGDAQLTALTNGKSAIRAQPTWAGESVRHSHLPRDEGDTPHKLSRQYW